MNGYSATTFALLVLALFCAAYAELVPWRTCPYEPGTPQNCTIHEVKVEPCAEGPLGKPCRLKRGTNASILFDYTADFEGETIEQRAYWANQVVDLPLLGMDPDGCKGTVCPITPGQRQSHSAVIPISKKFPVRSYDVKWKIWNDKDQECCFIFAIKLLK